ncbi:MAG: lyase family protein [Patescibacteria group bacterium]|nr:lyase family protein [Patescibacteria group bacterium]
MSDTRNLMMPGNPRYQPKELVPIWGYDNLMIPLAEVEIANLQTLGEFGIIPADEIAELTPEVIDKLKDIRTTAVDEIERTITRHDVLAWIHLGREILPPSLRRWLHVGLTSYDPLSTAYALQFSRAHQQVVMPKSKELAGILAGMVRNYADTLQVGRTHGQHALPITVGFWLATLLSRFLYCAQTLDDNADKLVGKISGAVGAYNAQFGLHLDRSAEGKFEASVLAKLGLKPARISTQILPPEPLTFYLFSALMLSGTFGQIGRDCRQLMRTEIREIREPFAKTQGGSSAMPHKRNPISFENSEGFWLKNKSEFGKVLECVISEHQRDLVGSSLMRDFPILIINLTHQLNTLLKKDRDGQSFLSRITVDTESCRRNFELSSDVVLAEPMWIALQMGGYGNSAHELVNKKLVPQCMAEGIPLIDALIQAAQDDSEIAQAFDRIPEEVIQLFHHPESYTGRASQKSLEIAELADDFAKVT